MATTLEDVLQRLNDVHRETTNTLVQVQGTVKQLEQKVDLRHTEMQQQVDELGVRVDKNSDALAEHDKADEKRFSTLESQGQATKTKLGLLMLLGGGGALSLDKIIAWLTGK